VFYFFLDCGFSIIFVIVGIIRTVLFDYSSWLLFNIIFLMLDITRTVFYIIFIFRLWVSWSWELSGLPFVLVFFLNVVFYVCLGVGNYQDCFFSCFFLDCGFYVFLCWIILGLFCFVFSWHCDVLFLSWYCVFPPMSYFCLGAV